MLPQKHTIKHLRSYKRTLPRSNQANPSHHANNARRAKRNPNYPSPPHRTSRRGPRRTLTTDITSVLSAQKKSGGIRVACGRVEHAGLSSIWAASRNGRPTRAPLLLDNRQRMARCHLRGNGVVLDAICRRMSCPRTSIAGARRSSIPNL